MCTTYSLYKSNETRFAFGPAWKQFFAYENFVPTAANENLENIIAEFFKTTYQPFLYAEARSRVYFCKDVNFNIRFGGGAYKHNNSTVSYLSSTGLTTILPIYEQVRPTNGIGSEVLLDASLGIDVSWRKKIYFNPQIGCLVYNQHFTLSVLRTPISYTFNNKWYGPCFNFEFTIEPQECHRLRASFKAFFGKNTTRFLYSSDPAYEIFQSINSYQFDPTSWLLKTPALGSIFNLEYVYMRDAMQYGVAMEYFRLRMPHKKQICLNTEETLNFLWYTKAIMQRMVWQQAAFTFFVQVHF